MLPHALIVTWTAFFLKPEKTGYIKTQHPWRLHILVGGPKSKSSYLPLTSRANPEQRCTLAPIFVYLEPNQFMEEGSHSLVDYWMASDAALRPNEA